MGLPGLRRQGLRRWPLRGQPLPGGVSQPLHPGDAVQPEADQADNRPAVHRQPARQRARVPARPAGVQRPGHPLPPRAVRQREAPRRPVRRGGLRGLPRELTHKMGR